MTLRLNVPDLAFGVFLVALGALALSARRASSRSAPRPRWGRATCRAGWRCIIMIYGAVLGVRAAFTGHEPFPAIAWRPLLLLSAAVALFANSAAARRPRGHQLRRRGLRRLCGL